MDEYKNGEHEQTQSWTWHRIGTWGAVLIIAYYLITEHRAHVIQYLPYIFLLACPLMHFFMHGKHSHGGHHHHHDDQHKKENS